MAWVVDDRGRERALSIGESYREALRCVAAELAHISDPGAFVVRIEDTEGDGIWLPVSWLPGNLPRPKAYFHRILRLLKARSVWQRNRLRRFFRQPLVVQIDTAVWDIKRLAIRVGIIKEKIPF